MELRRLAHKTELGKYFAYSLCCQHFYNSSQSHHQFYFFYKETNQHCIHVSWLSTEKHNQHNFLLRLLFLKLKKAVFLSKDYISLFYTLLMAYGLCDKVQFFSSLRLLLHQNVTHGFGVFVSVISSVISLVSTRVGVIRVSSSTKTDSGIRSIAVILFISNDADSGFGSKAIALNHSVEPFFVTIWL